MAIIIPSKDIYEINNQKVVDNEVDNVEFAAKNPSIISDTKIVYDEKINADPIDDEKQSEYTYEQVEVAPLGVAPQTAFAYVEETPKYDNIEITIPKSIKNSAILRILTGANDDGIPNIKYSLRGLIKQGDISGVVTLVNHSFSDPTFENLKLGQPTNIVTKQDTKYSISTSTEYPYVLDLGTWGTVTATEKFVLKNKSDILTAQTRDSEDNRNFIIDLKILSGIIINKVGGGGSENLDQFEIYLSGEYEEYTPTQIDISFYGDTLSLDLQDETVKIVHGQHVYSFEGNELMQTSNVPPISLTYATIINNWKNGKEVATLRCGMADYINEEENEETIGIRIDEKTAIPAEGLTPNTTSIIFYCVQKIDSEFIKESFIIDDSGYSHELTEIFFKGKNESLYGYSAKVKMTYDQVELGIVQAKFVYKGKIVISPNRKGVPMTFHIGDKVIPYVRGADGIDKPMSLYSDKKTPKQFLVIGKGIIADGEILQEINLQEIPQI